ncbi:TPA: cupin domain-containing protein [Candidatus Micrarchaeota archaeon]|nr:cupin domain-containing protein [Candidatus Micrarchaeota archaeon]
MAHKKGRLDKVKSHFHSEVWEYFIVFNGTAAIIVDGERVGLAKGGVVAIGPREKHLLAECSSDFKVLLLMDKFVKDGKHVQEWSPGFT